MDLPPPAIYHEMQEKFFDDIRVLTERYDANMAIAIGQDGQLLYILTLGDQCHQKNQQTEHKQQ